MVDKRVAFVTGAGRGIGLAIARRFVELGDRVVVVDVDPGVLELNGQSNGAIEAHVCDVSDSAAVDRVVTEVTSRFGRLDVMVCNAGIGGGGPIAELGDDLLHRILAVNLFGAIACCRAAAKVMISQKSGVIVTIGSIFGQDPPAGSSVYGASKAGVTAFSRSLARELGPYGIRVNCVSPGNIETEMYANATKRRATSAGISLEEAKERELLPIPLGHLGSPEDVAKVVTWLASPDASYLTGQRINIDGGIQPW